MSHPYTVALEDAQDLPSSNRITAETRFAASIERALGGADAVASTYRAWVNASESDASHLDRDTAALAVQWPRAFDAARQAAMRDIGELPGAHFEVRLERAHAGS
ncbi:hypothetical protein ACFPOE_17965 [Caenimonas terrae]|uniref:Uncharacterized protein n=1 Tax=Caenimonas terrae TaxID=696074 RepID=A0ABW0NHC6_9BURK